MAPMMMTPMMIGTTQLIIILVIVVVLFGGAKLSGLGKSMGSAIREFKEETKGMGGDESGQQAEVVDAEVVEPEDQQPSAPPQMNASTPDQPGPQQQPGGQASQQPTNQGPRSS